MDKELEAQKQMENEIIKDNIKNINEYIRLTNEDTLYFNLYNEYLFENHNKWLDNIKNQIKKGIDNSDSNIKISDINYDNKIITIIKKIVEPHNYRNNNKNNENINKNSIFEKIEELTNFNDIIGTINICTKNKRKSLLSTIHKKRNNDNNENNYINIDNNENNRITFQENKNESDNNNNYNDEDININDYIPSNQKEKIINNNIYPYPYNKKEEEEEENSLCTIVEQPSNEELEKNNTMSQNSNNLFNSKQYSFSNQIKNQFNLQNNQNNNNKSNYVLNVNNKINNNNIVLNKIPPHSDNKKNYKPLNIIESIITPQKNNNFPLSQNINNNNYLFSNTYSKINHVNLLHSQQKSPYFAEIKNSEDSSNKNNIPINNIGLINNSSQFSFNNSNKNISNFNEFTFSTVKKFENNLSNNKNDNLSNNKNDIIVIHTSRKKELEKNYLSNNKNDNNSNNKNFINILTNSIHNIYNQKIENNSQIKNNLNKNELNRNNYVQNIVLSSLKKNNDNLNNVKGKYEKDFEEYEMSDSSIKEDDEEEKKTKFIPKWAKDKEYINQLIKKQNNNKELIYKSFGNFVVENLNLNMIFETHNENFDIRNSTADWRGDDSFARNKIINIDDKEIDDMFPNRKLQF